MPDPTEPIDLESANAGELIRWHRANMRLSDGAIGGMLQSELADELGVSHTYLSLVESGQRRFPDAGLLHRICDILGLSQRDRERLLERWASESESALERRLTKFGRSESEFLPGIPLDAARALFDRNPTARAALMAWLRQMPLRRRRVGKGQGESPKATKRHTRRPR